MTNEAITNTLSIEELKQLKAQFPSNKSIIEMVDAELKSRADAEEAEAVKVAFGLKIAELANLPVPPDDVHNVYLSYKDVEVAKGAPYPIGVNDKGEPNGVDVTQAELKAIKAQKPEVGATVKVGDKSFQIRQPTEKQKAWVVEVNKGFSVGKSSTNGTPTASKRAITLSKRNGNQLTFVGNFPSASKACEHLKINVGGDSATRVLHREGYILDPYNGTDYTK